MKTKIFSVAVLAAFLLGSAQLVQAAEVKKRQKAAPNPAATQCFEGCKKDEADATAYENCMNECVAKHPPKGDMPATGNTAAPKR